MDIIGPTNLLFTCYRSYKLNKTLSLFPYLYMFTCLIVSVQKIVGMPKKISKGIALCEVRSMIDCA